MNCLDRHGNNEIGRYELGSCLSPPLYNGVTFAIIKDKFEKSCVINWSDRLYFIKQALATRPLTYIVEDDQGNQHKGTFYEQELQANHDQCFRIEKILRYKTEKGKRYALVKWIGYDSSYNSWEPVDGLINLKDGSDGTLPKKQKQAK